MRDHPALVLLASVVALWLATWAGRTIFGRRRVVDEQSRSDFFTVVGGILTLLALIIGFSFSMAVTRYDLRKSCEETEANAIGTEFVRAEFLTAADAQRVRALLTSYADLRVRDYVTRDEADVRRINDQTGRMQGQLWSAVRTPAMAQPTPLMALAASGMNDVLNSRGYTQAALRNRIPRSVWWLMAAIAVVGCALVGYGARSFKAEAHFLWVLPAVISISFFLIADIDSPRHGWIRANPQNLVDVARSMHASLAATPG
jgi:hypothetical protein